MAFASLYRFLRSVRSFGANGSVSSLCLLVGCSPLHNYRDGVNIITLHDTPSGDCDLVSFVLANQPFMAISAGPLFKFNPSASFHVKLKTKEEVDAIWEQLSFGGDGLLTLDDYSFWGRDWWGGGKYTLYLQ